MRRRILFTITGLLLALPVADTIAWNISIGRLETGFRAWAENAAANGWVVTHGKFAPGGWPWSAQLAVRNLTVRGGPPVISGGAFWHAPSIVLKVALTRPLGLEIEAVGEQRLKVGTMPEAILTGSRLWAVVGLGALNDAGDLEIAAERPRLTAGADWIVTAGRLRVRVEQPKAMQTADTATGFSVGADDIVLPASVRWPLGRTIARLDVDGTMEGVLPPAQDSASWAATWRDAGGSLQLRNLMLIWGPLNLTAAATLALDDQLQPMGAGTSRVIGYAAALDALADGGTLTRSATTAAKAVLSLLAGSSDDQEPADVEVPLTIQYRTLSLRQIPLLRLPEIDWPGQ